MSRKQRYVASLSEKEQASLIQGYKTGNSPVYQRRCHCILLSSRGYSVNDLAELFGVSTITVYDWFNRWESSGLAGMELRSGRGRKRKLDPDNAEHVKAVRVLVENEPQQLSRVVGKVKSELGIEVSRKTLKRFLKKLDSDGSALGAG